MAASILQDNKSHRTESLMELGDEYVFICTSLFYSLPTLGGLSRVCEALSLKLNWFVSFGFLSVLEATLSGLSSSSPSPTSSAGVTFSKPTGGK